MSIFDDKKFDQLDWVSQMTETIDSEVNTLLAQLPDRTKLDLEKVLGLADIGYFGVRLSLRNAVQSILKAIPNRPYMTWEAERTVDGCFCLEISDNFTLDFEKNEMMGEVYLVKTIPTIDDETLQKQMGVEGLYLLRHINTNEGSIGRMNEVMELLGGLEEQLKSRSMRKKLAGIRHRLQTIFEKNEWRIRDTKLANNVSKWIVEYVENGNLAAFSNFCKLKVMTHQNMPIYSIEEQE